MDLGEDYMVILCNVIATLLKIWTYFKVKC